MKNLRGWIGIIPSNGWSLHWVVPPFSQCYHRTASSLVLIRQRYRCSSVLPIGFSLSLFVMLFLHRTTPYTKQIPFQPQILCSALSSQLVQTAAQTTLFWMMYDNEPPSLQPCIRIFIALTSSSTFHLSAADIPEHLANGEICAADEILNAGFLFRTLCRARNLPGAAWRGACKRGAEPLLCANQAIGGGGGRRSF